MTTTVKLDSKLYAGAVPDTLAKEMWDALGSHHMAIVEMRVTERTEPAVGESEPSAKLRVSSIEFATDEHDDERLRQALRDRFQARTASGTLDGVADDAAWTARTQPGVGFHEHLLKQLGNRQHLGGYDFTVERDDVTGDVVLRVTTEKHEDA